MGFVFVAVTTSPPRAAMSTAGASPLRSFPRKRESRSDSQLGPRFRGDERRREALNSPDLAGWFAALLRPFPLRHPLRLDLDRVRAALLHALRRDGLVRRVVEIVHQPVQILVRRHPARRLVTGEREKPR